MRAAAFRGFGLLIGLAEVVVGVMLIIEASRLVSRESLGGLSLVVCGALFIGYAVTGRFGFIRARHE